MKVYLLKHLYCPSAGLRQLLSPCTLRLLQERLPACHPILGFKVPRRDHGLSLEFKVPELDHGLILQFKVPELLIFPLRFGGRDKFVAVILPRTPKHWSIACGENAGKDLRPKRVPLRMMQRPVPSGGVEQSKGKSPDVEPTCMKKTRAPLAENPIKELDIVMSLAADKLDPVMNPEEIPLVTVTEIIPVVHLRMTAAIVSRSRSV